MKVWLSFRVLVLKLASQHIDAETCTSWTAFRLQRRVDAFVPATLVQPKCAT